ncbi:MAG: MoaD/ThiS family protein [Chitinophagaceae bacterium]|nr:MoaD/ThiS family protein [Chitinophagaceae bacterium]
MNDTIQVKFFGPLLDIMGKENLQCPFIENTDLLKEYLFASYPALEKTSFSIAINQQIISSNTALEVGQTIAFLPPFSGG